MKWIKIHHAPTVVGRRGWNNWKSADGVFFIRRNIGGARWVITTRDGSEPFTGYMGRRSHVALADNITDAKRKCELVNQSTG